MDRGPQHRWNRKGPWQLIGDRRSCIVCGLRAYKTGQKHGWMTARGSQGGTYAYSKALPPCEIPKRRPAPEPINA